MAYRATTKKEMDWPQVGRGYFASYDQPRPVVVVSLTTNFAPALITRLKKNHFLVHLNAVGMNKK